MLCQVDPNHVTNAWLLEHRNSESCEQLNAWISGRTAAALNLSAARFGTYWNICFAEHNEWLVRCAEAKRRRFEAGVLKRDPDKPQPRDSVRSKEKRKLFAVHRADGILLHYGPRGRNI